MTALYETRIHHARTAPVKNRFTYRGYWWLVDLDDLPRPSALRSFEARDHCGDPSKSLRDNVVDFLAEHDLDLQAGQILMLASARSLGYVFNPLSIYWCHHRNGDRLAVVAEVHNTYGGRHRYLLGKPDSRGRALRRQEAVCVALQRGRGLLRDFRPATG